MEEPVHLTNRSASRLACEALRGGGRFATISRYYGREALLVAAVGCFNLTRLPPPSIHENLALKSGLPEPVTVTYFQKTGEAQCRE